MAVLLAPPVLEVYYAPSCAPCRLELPVLAEFVRRDGAHIRIVILSEEARARRELRAASPQLSANAVVGSQASPRAILRAAGDNDSILPYARSLGADGKVCAAWRGRLTLEKAWELVSACARKLTSHPSHRS